MLNKNNNIQNDFYLVRHGESENNILAIESSKMENKKEFGLTHKGKTITLREARNYTQFNLIISSPFRRALETARIFANFSNCKIIEENLLREVDVGDFENQAYSQSEKFLKKKGFETLFWGRRCTRMRMAFCCRINTVKLSQIVC